METPDQPFSLIDLLKSWIPWRSEPDNVSRHFWMPDRSCRVCYECDLQFTVINRRHHCRLCGRVFCGKCTGNFIPVYSCSPRNVREEPERIRVCNFCLKEKNNVAEQNRVPSNDGESPSLSTTSLVSSQSSSTVNTGSVTGGSSLYTTGSYRRLLCGSDASLGHSPHTEPEPAKQETGGMPGRSMDSIPGEGNPSINQYSFRTTRSDDDYEEYVTSRCDSSDAQRFNHSDIYYGPIEYDEAIQDYQPYKMLSVEENHDAKGICSAFHDNAEFLGSLDADKMTDEAGLGNSYDDHTSSIYSLETADSEPVDFENNGLLWLPPEPEDDDDERELGEDGDADVTDEYGYLCSSNSIGSGEYRSRDQTNEEHNRAMKNVVDGHFRALIAQLLQVENFSVGEEGEKGSWLEIITCLSWEAATLLKPDTSKGGGMDPGGYVKVKCIASGHRSQSMVVKGVVCKKNVAHRRMISKIEKPSFLILGGALEYQRVTNSLSSFDTLLQQEVDHLKMAVAKIEAHHPHVLLVEKSVSRFAQECLLAKNISLVLNMKRPLLEHIARCTGSQIVPSIDHLSSQKLGHCDRFHVDKFFEEHGSAGQGGKKLMKTFMFFEGCPKPLGCTVLLMGASGDELKKVKHVIQYGVFAAYHLALETSFLADEGAFPPDLPLKVPATVALPDKPSNFDKSDYTVPGFTTPANKPQLTIDVQRPNTYMPTLASNSSGKMEATLPSYYFERHSSQLADVSSTYSIPASTKKPPAGKRDHASALNYSQLHSPSSTAREKNKVCFGGTYDIEISRNDQTVKLDSVASNICDNSSEISQGTGVMAEVIQTETSNMMGKQLVVSGLANMQQENGQKNENTLPKEGFHTSDHQSILVSLSRRCVWKGTVCERSHLFRIKYYGSFDKPLGRFLRDDLFDQSNPCRSCEMAPEAHVHCYTHQQGSLIISVRNLPEFLLPGEEEGKIWMWHRCLRCPRTHGLPPATRRVVMSDAAWGLSLGKFLELSFSNNAAASRVASCGHSLHKDCLRFYGFGKMVACFRYASIDVHSVHLPPLKLDFNYEHQEWIQNEANEVADRTELLFTEVYNALQQISEGRRNLSSHNGNLKSPESRQHTLELEEMLQKEKVEFEESLQKLLNKEASKGHPVIDILEVNKLRRQLLFQSYLWDQRLIFAAGLGSITDEIPSGSSSKDKEKACPVEKVADPNLAPKSHRSFTGSYALSSDSRIDEAPKGGISFSHQEGFCDNLDSSNVGQKQVNIGLDSFQGKQSKIFLSTSISASDKLGPLEYGLVARRTLSDGQFPLFANLSETFDAKWRGEENIPLAADASMSDSSASVEVTATMSFSEDSEERNGSEVTQSFASALLTKLGDSAEDFSSWIGMPFRNIYRSMNKNWGTSSRFDTLNEYHPIYVSLFRELERQGGARLLLPIGVDEIVIPIYDDEPTSIISYALASPDYHMQMLDERVDSSFLMSSSDLGSFHPYQSNDDIFLDPFRSFGPSEDGILSLTASRSTLGLDPLTSTKSMHSRVTFADDGPLGKVKYTVTCYYAKLFDALRRTCCPSELDFIRSLSRCKKWGAQGGKSNVFFAKSFDDRFIIKQVTKTELESFIKFAPDYFKYLSRSIGMGGPTCLAKILGIYQVTSKQLKGGKELKMDVLVMENLFFGRCVTRLYDLKGSSRSRYNPDSSGNNKVLLDQNLIEAMPASPIFVGDKAKRLLERAVWNDTNFLASIDVMDYSLLVGIDEVKHELVLGIIDFMRQYTWDKHLETWVKASGILGGPKNVSPTVISPKQYKKRFRKAMATYFLVVPDQWSYPTAVFNPGENEQPDPGENEQQSSTAEM